MNYVMQFKKIQTNFQTFAHIKIILGNILNTILESG